MKNTRRRWAWTVTFVMTTLGAALAAVLIRHRWEKLITEEDIAAFAAAFTLIATGLAFVAARESRDAASDSRRALQLHFRPTDVRVAFSVRDPNDPQAQMPYTPLVSPTHLWVSLLFYELAADQYDFVYIDDVGQAHSRTLTPTPGVEDHIRLDGIVATEDRTDGPARIKAGNVLLKLLCVDNKINGRWQFAKTWPAGTSLGSYRGVFQPED